MVQTGPDPVEILFWGHFEAEGSLRVVTKPDFLFWSRGGCILAKNLSLVITLF